MKVNVVVVQNAGIERVPVDIANMLHLEIETEEGTFCIAERGGPGLWVSGAHGGHMGLIIKPRASNAVEIRVE